MCESGSIVEEIWGLPDSGLGVREGVCMGCFSSAMVVRVESNDVERPGPYNKL